MTMPGRMTVYRYKSDREPRRKLDALLRRYTATLSGFPESASVYALTLLFLTRDNSGHSGQARKYEVRSVPTSRFRLGTTRDRRI